MNSKRGQFFILAAVLIASIVFSLSVAKNTLVGRDSPDDFYLIGEQLNSELKAVLDYNLVSGDNKVSNFTNESIEYFRKTKPHTEVIFLYVIDNNLTVENYADSPVNISGFSACGTCTVGTGAVDTFSITFNDFVNVTFREQVLGYDLSKGSKSYIVLSREIDREVYIDVQE